MGAYKCSLCGGDVLVNRENTMGVCTRCGATVSIPGAQSPYFGQGYPQQPYRPQQGYRQQSYPPPQQSYLSQPSYQGRQPGQPRGDLPAAGLSPENLLRRGTQYLEVQDWNSAREYFNRVLDLDANCAEGHLGLALAGSQVGSLEQYVQKLSSQFSAEPPRRFSACEPDTARVRELEESLAVEGYLTPEQIGAELAFDRSFPSREPAAAENKQRILRLLGENSFLARAKKHADPGLRIRLEQAEQTVLAAYDRRIREAGKDAALAREDTVARYRAHLEQAAQTVRTLREKALARRENDYQQACRLQQSAQSPEEFEAAAGLFAGMGDYQDCPGRVSDCRASAEASREMQRKRKKRQGIIGILVSLAALILLVGGYFVTTRFVIPNTKYNRAKALMQEGSYSKAILAFQKMNGYKDSEELILRCRYEIADGLDKQGDSYGAALLFDQLEDYEDARARSAELWESLAVRELISAGTTHTVAITEDGTVRATGSNLYGECDVSGWTDVVSVSAGNGFTLALRADGSVLAAGRPEFSEAARWTGIRAISAGGNLCAGLRSDGSVCVICSDGSVTQPDVKDWTDVISIAAGGSHLAALLKDGRVVAAGKNDTGDGQCNVSAWRDIVAISAGDTHTVGLRKDGTVVAVGRQSQQTCSVGDWTGICAISAGGNHTVGLKEDGTLVTTGEYFWGQCKVENWKNIVAVSAGRYHTVALTTGNGVRFPRGIVATHYAGSEDSYYGQCEVSDWSDVKLPQ